MDRRFAPSTIRRAQRSFAAIFAVFVAAVTVLALTNSWSKLAWIGVPTMSLPFADVRPITAASSAIELGLDPMVENPGDPWQRPLNYPRVWQALASVGVGPQHTEAVALVFWLLFAGGLLAMTPLLRRPRTVGLLAAALFAPPTWLAIERANSDLAIFGLVSIAAWLTVRRPFAAASAIGAAALLKLYPIAALLSLLPSRRTAVRLAVPVVVLFAIYVGLQTDDIGRIRDGTQHAPFLAYGVETVPDLVAKNAGVPFALALAAALLLMATVAVCGYLGRQRMRLGAAGTPATMAAFRVGAAVFIGSFCIGTSFDYRLIFLLLTLPQLGAWAHRSARSRGLASATICITLLLLWSLTWRRGLSALLGTRIVGLGLDELLSWSLWCALAVLVTLSLPEWLLPARLRGAPLLDEPSDVPPLPTAGAPAARPQRLPGA